MMRGVYSVATIRAAESAAIAVSGEAALMQRAAAALAAVVARELRTRRGAVHGARVLVVTGSGNNGGDALFAAARLARRGVRVRAWRPGSGVHEAGWLAFLAVGGRELDAAGADAALVETDLVIDGVAGIGGRAGLRTPVADFARACAVAQVPVVAVDLPSGVPADLPFVSLVPAGEQTDPVPVPEPARSTIGDGLAAHFTADVTVTFGGLKACHVIEPARSACGRIELIDIGLPPMEPELECWEPADLRAAWPVPAATSDKYSRGVVGVDAGSVQYPGAGVLAVTGAVRAGAGMVRYLGPSEVARLVLERLPNVVTGEGRVQALALGSGWGDRPDGPDVVAAAVASGLPIVVDADALGMLPYRLHPQVLLTPHAGELARLLGIAREQVTADPVAAVRHAVARTGGTVLLKGATQVVATQGRTSVEIAVHFPSWTAQAGSGDLLAGICSALLAAGLPAPEAAAVGASIQAMAAPNAPLPPQEYDIAAVLRYLS
ncbi:MAG: bifunctional ADP-dependent NAD(P)H-hydrate dehydratase/NAD(P)H-hydrate epimerase [Propionibacteriaceae bacterium]|nr:bifunctional ADP-dependent NAD(P)H-hydrate dehydratase/NAD(P)H-hydrate epimerase [Propionibacteriaceae bacterium]